MAHPPPFAVVRRRRQKAVTSGFAPAASTVVWPGRLCKQGVLGSSPIVSTPSSPRVSVKHTLFLMFPPAVPPAVAGTAVRSPEVDRRVASIRYQCRHSGGPLLVGVKSAAGRRVLSLPTPLVDQVRRHSVAQAAERLRTGSRWQDHGLVLARVDGSSMRKETDSAQWHRILKIAGVRQGRLHDARHTAATLLLAQSVLAGVAMRLLRHSDVRVTARYQHRSSDVATRIESVRTLPSR